jgi:hypothetical protein
MLSTQEGVMRGIEEQSGKSFDAWIQLGRARGPKERKPLVAWFREQHAFKPMQAAWLAQGALGGLEDYGDPAAFVDALYAGKRKALRPLHEALVDACYACGDDVVVTACKTMVPAYRKHVFAELRPAASDEGVLLRLALGGAPTTARLVRDTHGMPGERLSHAVVVEGPRAIDKELQGWLSQAYALGAGTIAKSIEFETPPELAKGMKASKPAAATWGAMTPAMQRDMAQWITSAKGADTRTRRVATCLEKLADGRKRVY